MPRRSSIGSSTAFSSPCAARPHPLDPVPPHELSFFKCQAQSSQRHVHRRQAALNAPFIAQTNMQFLVGRIGLLLDQGSQVNQIDLDDRCSAARPRSCFAMLALALHHAANPRTTDLKEFSHLPGRLATLTCFDNSIPQVLRIRRAHPCCSFGLNPEPCHAA